ncbi:MAG: glycosyltransferase family 2 protein [Methanotrichaceae archaeon]
MGKHKPLVSIITPSFNQDKFIEYAILSVKNQCYPNIEHIIIDGRSTDNTLDIIRKYEGEYNLRWISEPDQGQSDAINKGFKMAKGEIIGWINSDDAYFSKYTIDKVAKFFEDHEKATIAYGDAIYIDSKNTVIRILPVLPAFKYSALKTQNVLAQPSVFFKKCIVDEYKLNPFLHHAMDYDFWLRIGEHNKFFRINEILSCFRLHEASKTMAQSSLWKDELAIIAKNDTKSWGGPTFMDRATHVARILLPLLSLPAALWLYARQDLAFDIRLPSKKNMITNTLLIPELCYRLRYHKGMIR